MDRRASTRIRDAGTAHRILAARAAREAGQGTVEYVGMIVLLAVIVGAAIFAADHALGGTVAGAIRAAFADALRRFGVGG